MALFDGEADDEERYIQRATGAAILLDRLNELPNIRRLLTPPKKT